MINPLPAKESGFFDARLVGTFVGFCAARVAVAVAVTVTVTVLGPLLSLSMILLR